MRQALEWLPIGEDDLADRKLCREIELVRGGVELISPRFDGAPTFLGEEFFCPIRFGDFLFPDFEARGLFRRIRGGPED